MRVVVVLGVLAACGRIGFDAAGTDGDGGVDDAIDAPDMIDAVDAALLTCAGGDSICNSLCTSTDPDCVTTCGDGLCVGNVGELCTSCPGDCNTPNPVCGNGACDPQESSLTCLADCGPSPWPWAADEDAIIGMINSIRLAGVTCPSGPPFLAVPAVTFAPALLPGVREWAWEYAHHRWNMDDACNGRTVLERGTAAGATGPFSFAYVFGASSSTDAVNFWIADPVVCPSLVDAQYTTITVGVARDLAPNGYVVILD